MIKALIIRLINLFNSLKFKKMLAKKKFNKQKNNI